MSFYHRSSLTDDNPREEGEGGGMGFWGKGKEFSPGKSLKLIYLEIPLCGCYKLLIKLVMRI